MFLPKSSAISHRT